MLSKDEAVARVTKGAAFLDARWPRWFDHVNVNTLEMAYPCSCVLGQIDGDYNESVGRLWPDSNLISKTWRTVFGDVSPKAETMGIALGFDVDHVNGQFKAEVAADYALVKDAWIDAIAVRRFPSDERSDEPVAERCGKKVTA